MRPDARAAVLAAFAVAITAAVSVWGYTVDSDPGPRWLFAATFLPALWAFVERAQVRGDDVATGRALMTMHRYCIAWAGLLLSSQIGLRLAVHEGMLDAAWLDTGRVFGGLLLGVGMVLFGNYLPKLRSPWTLLDQPFAWQQVHRFVGWVFVVAGLALVACWTMLSIESAARATAQILPVVMVLGVGRKLASVFAHA